MTREQAPALAPAPKGEERRDVMDEGEARQLAALFEDKGPEDVLEWAFQRFGPRRFALVSSFQAEGMVLIHMARRLCDQVRVLTVDTGRLPQETYALMDTVRDRYGIPVEVLFPERAAVEAMVNRYGMNLFYRGADLRRLCCRVRKVEPLQRALAGVDAWATGVRRAHGGTRAAVPKVAVDPQYGGIVKVCPLADWSDAQVWKYIVEHRVPYHPLYDQGYKSIGCEPCTRPVQAGEPPRSGRWWWEEGEPKECGIHWPGGARNGPAAP